MSVSDDLFASAGWLSLDSNRGYGSLPIPKQRDKEISHLLRTWIELDERVRETSAAQMTDEQSRILLAYSERMASLAVRERKGDFLFLGLVALGLAGGLEDWRECLLRASLLFDAAQRIGSDPNPVFEKVAAVLPHQETASELRQFLARSAEDKSIEAMGFAAGSDEQGFRYQRAL
jgi:hypothetical protein